MATVTVENITSAANQVITMTRDAGDVDVTLKYHDTTNEWTLDAVVNGRAVYGARMAANVRLIPSALLGVDFFVNDNNEIGLDPWRLDDFEAGRYTLVMFDV